MLSPSLSEESTQKRKKIAKRNIPKEIESEYEGNSYFFSYFFLFFLISTAPEKEKDDVIGSNEDLEEISGIFFSFLYYRVG